MFGLRIYLAVLNLTFLVLTLLTRGIGVLEATVIVCPFLYMILDMRTELHSLRLLEAKVCLLRR